MLGFKKVKKEVKVQGMHCAHCASRVEKAIMGIDKVKSVKIDLASGLVTIVSFEQIDDARISTAVTEAGFEVA